MKRYEYNAFGKTISQSGSMAEFFRHRFSTKYYDSETALYYYGYRFYSPVLMRWLNRDPIGETGGLNLYGFCHNASVRRVDSMGNIPVAVETWKRNVFLQRIINGGDKYSIVSVRKPSDISVENMTSSTKWGLFARSLRIENCRVVVTLRILLNERMPETGRKDVTYQYKPHVGDEGGVSFTTDGSPQIRGGILAHELGHARAFLETFLPKFQSEVDRFKAGRLTESDKSEIKRIFNRCINEASIDSGNNANEAQANWYMNNGYKFEIVR